MNEHGTPVTVTVAATQFEVGSDIARNLAACLRVIDEAAARGARIIVLPEFCNHLSWYPDRATAHRLACRRGDAFLTALAERAARHRVHVKTGVTYAHSDGRTTGASLLHGPDGSLLGHADKQILMGSENDFLDPADRVGPVVATAHGRLGMYACMEGVITEVTRSLAVRGAQVLLNSLNSFATDEASLHIPVRAAENHVWVVAANKIGPLVPPDMAATVAAGLGIPVDRLHGAGESQIVAPDGTVVARGPRDREAVVIADIEPARADDKRRPDGTDTFATRRPALYRELACAPRPERRRSGADRALARVASPAGSGADAVAEAASMLGEAVADGVDLVVFPELFPYRDDFRGPASTDPARATLDALGRALVRGHTYAVAALPSPEGDALVGYVVGPAGVVHAQTQLHRCARHAHWVRRLGDALEPLDLPFGRLAVLVGDDVLHPETTRLAAIAGAEVVAVSHAPTQDWEFALGLAERAAENRVNVVAAGREGPGLRVPPGGVFALSPDFTLWTAWENPFTGQISHPLVTAQHGPTTTAPIRPALAANRLVSRGTDLVDGRPWHLVDALVTPPVAPA